MEDKKLLDKIEKKIIQILKKEGGAAGLDPLKKAVDKMDQPKGFNLKSILKKMKNVEKHKNSDYILTPINEDNGAMKKSKKGMAMYGKKMNQESLEELKGLFEKLCKKGQAYRRKRMAAGEKSSAYLSGRAVKVCKGQMKGEAKQDTRFTVDGKPVDLGSIEMGGLESMRKYGPDDGGPDAYIESAYFLDGTELTDIQKDEFMDKYPDITYEKAVDQMYQQEGAVEADMSIQEVLDMNIIDENITEAKYKGKTVTLNKPMRGDSKKFKVYVNSGKKNADGSIKVKKVNFGHGGTSAKRPTMRIRKSDPKRRKAFRARHRCDNPGPKTMARYWSCKKW